MMSKPSMSSARSPSEGLYKSPCDEVGLMRVASASRRSLTFEGGRYLPSRFRPGCERRRTTWSPLSRGILIKSIMRKMVLNPSFVFARFAKLQNKVKRPARVNWLRHTYVPLVQDTGNHLIGLVQFLPKRWSHPSDCSLLQ